MGKLGGVMANAANASNPRRATARQVADRYGVTVPTVFNWLRAGIIPAKVAVGRVYRFDLEEVEAALQRRSIGTGQPAEESPASGCGSAARELTQPNPERPE
jgi:excisionase family DNA binding protein